MALGSELSAGVVIVAIIKISILEGLTNPMEARIEMLIVVESVEVGFCRHVPSAEPKVQASALPRDRTFTA